METVNRVDPEDGWQSEGKGDLRSKRIQRGKTKLVREIEHKESKTGMDIDVHAPNPGEPIVRHAFPIPSQYPLSRISPHPAEHGDSRYSQEKVYD